MSFPKARDYAQLLQTVVANMNLPFWFEREEALGIGYLAISGSMSKYRKSKHRCSFETYLSNSVRYAVRRTIDLEMKRRNRHVSIDALADALEQKMKKEETDEQG